MLFQCWASVEDGGPTLKQPWVNASCLLGYNSIYQKIFSFCLIPHFNPLTAKLFNLNLFILLLFYLFYYSDLTKWRSTLFKSCWLMSHFIFNIFKMWYLMC